MQSAWQRALKHRFVGCNRRCVLNLDFMLHGQDVDRGSSAPLRRVYIALLLQLAVEGRLHADSL